MIVSFGVDHVDHSFLNTETAAAYDYIVFIEEFLATLKEDMPSLQKQAEANGRTIDAHPMVKSGAFGSSKTSQA